MCRQATFNDPRIPNDKLQFPTDQPTDLRSILPIPCTVGWLGR